MREYKISKGCSVNLYLERLLLSFRSQVIEGVNPIWVVETRGAIKFLKYEA